MKEKKIFISGKITGEPFEECSDKFYHAIRKVQNQRQWGECVNPLQLEGIYIGIPHEEAMEICLAELKTCQYIFMLEDWQESKGARIEHDFAKKNGIEIIYESKMVEVGLNYEYKGEVYQAKERIQLKHPTTGEWVSAILYGERRGVKNFCRTEDEFSKKFKKHERPNSQ